MSIQCQHNLPRETCWMCNATTRLANAGITTPTNDDLIKELARQVADLREQLAAARARVAELEGERDIWHKECDRREDERIKAEQRTDFARQRAKHAEADLAEALGLLQEASDDWVPHASSLSVAIAEFLRGTTMSSTPQDQYLAVCAELQQCKKDLAATRKLLVETRKWVHDRNVPTFLVDRIDAALAGEKK